MFLPSCSEEEIYQPGVSDSLITVKAHVSAEWLSGADGARSGSDAGPQGERIRKTYKAESSQCTEPLYIFETVSDRIESPAVAGEAAPESRGAIVHAGESFEQLGMGVYSYFSGRPDSPVYMQNVEYGFSDKRFWEVKSNVYYWPSLNSDSDMLTFFAYAPYNADNNGKTGIPRMHVYKENDNYKLRYTVADSIDCQPDLLVSDLTSVGKSNIPSGGLPLSFHHALTSVRISCASKSMYPGRVTNIKFYNVVREGVFDISSGEWEETENPGLYNFSFNCNSRINEAGQGDTKDTFSSLSADLLGTKDYTLMMIPQNSRKRQGPKPVLEITFTDDGTRTRRVFSQQLDIDWEKGKSVCYTISNTNMHSVYTFDVKVKGGSYADSADPDKIVDGEGREIYVCGNAGIDASRKPEVTVRSFYTTYQYSPDGTVELSSGRCPARWSAEMVYRKGNEFITELLDDNFVTNLDKFHGISDLDNGRIETVLPLDVDAIAVHSVRSEESTWLNSQTTRTLTAGYDLSMESGKMNTANCYIVDRAGRYRIPLVYGNAYKDGQPNPAAYTCKSGSGQVLSTFLRPDGQAIQDPWICNNTASNGRKLKPAKAEIIRFQSIAGNSDNETKSGERAFHAFQIVDDGKYLYFEIDKAERTMYPCNALIAVKDASGNILWTWHIWLTGIFKNEADPTVQLGNYHVMKYSLGQLEGNYTIFADRKFYIKFTQHKEAHNDLGESRIVGFTQYGHEDYDYPQSLYYQFGRMTPVYALLFRKTVNADNLSNIKRYHRVFRSAHLKDEEENSVHPKASIATVLQHPLWLFNTSGKAYTTEYGNLWNNGTVENPVKTVYDPCPPGYMVPPQEFVPLANGASAIFNLNDYRIECGGLTFPRGTLSYYVDKDGAYSHNDRYTTFWTGNRDSAGKNHAMSFSFNADSNDYVFHNNPTYAGLVYQKSLGTSYLAQIRPIKEP